MKVVAKSRGLASERRESYPSDDPSSASVVAGSGFGFDEGTSHSTTEGVLDTMKSAWHGDDAKAVKNNSYTALCGAAFRGTNDVKNKDGWSAETLALGPKFESGGFNRHKDTVALLRPLEFVGTLGGRS